MTDIEQLCCKIKTQPVIRQLMTYFFVYAWNMFISWQTCQHKPLKVVIAWL